MKLRVKATNVLRSIKQAWGTPGIKRGLWDGEYSKGRWDHCEHSPKALVYEYVERYAKGGSILDLGSGSGNTATELKSEAYRSYTGVDVSQVALDKAQGRSETAGRGRQNQFLQGDFMAFVPPEKYDVILFRESIYYVPLFRVTRVLDRYRPFLAVDGVVIVNVGPSATKKARQILDLIENNFQVIEKYAPAGQSEFVAVFR